MDDQLYTRFEAIGDSHWWFEGRRQIVEAVLEEVLGPVGPDPRRTVLDLGCGTGTMLAMLGRFGTVTGLEMSADAVAVSRAAHPGVDVHVGILPDGLAPGSRFDLVGAFDVVEHIEDDRAAVTHIHDTVEPGGLFVSTVPAFPVLWGHEDVLSHHFRRYRRKSYRSLLEAAGFEVEHLSYFNTWLFPAAATVRIGRRLVGGGGGDAPRSDLGFTSPRLDRALTSLFASERHLVRKHALPFGVSLLAVARRRA